MKFFCPIKDLAVNSKKTGRTIARFKDGVFETDNPELIAKMQIHFENDGMNFGAMDYWKLREMAEQKGIKCHNFKEAKLIRALERNERNEKR